MLRHNWGLHHEFKITNWKEVDITLIGTRVYNTGSIFYGIKEEVPMQETGLSGKGKI